MTKSNMDIIIKNIFEDDLYQHTFYITSSAYIKTITDINININNLLKKKKYEIYKYANGLLLEYLLIKFAKYNMIQIFNEQKHIDIILRFSTFLDEKKPTKKISYNISTNLSNELIEINKKIKNKKNLYFEMLKNNPEICKKYLCETFMLKDITNIDSIYILRPFNLSGGGKNIFIVQNTKELNNIKKKIDVNNYIASKYIMNPLLFKDKKFHLRVSFMITYINDNIDYSIFKHIRILQAKLPYKNEDFFNKDIHDSHVSSTDDDYLFYNEFKNILNYNDIIYQIKLVINECFNLIKSEVKSYPESKNAFEIFVCDFMITDDYIVKLLEVNHGDIGYNFLNIKNNNISLLFNKNFFGWIFNKSILPIFFPKLLLFNDKINIKNKYYNVTKNNNIYTITLNIKSDYNLIHYIIIINLLCPYKKVFDINILDLTKNNLWEQVCKKIKCNYIIKNDNNKHNIIINNNFKNINNFIKSYIIMNEFQNHESYKGTIKFGDDLFYIYKN